MLNMLINLYYYYYYYYYYFKSRREGTVSAKINIPASDAKLVNTDDFWPMYVQCKPWQHTYDKHGFERRRNTTLKGYYNCTSV